MLSPPGLGCHGRVDAPAVKCGLELKIVRYDVIGRRECWANMPPPPCMLGMSFRRCRRRRRVTYGVWHAREVDPEACMFDSTTWHGRRLGTWPSCGDKLAANHDSSLVHSFSLKMCRKPWN